MIGSTRDKDGFRAVEGARYRGAVIVEWPPATGGSPYAAMAGWGVRVTDAVSGKLIVTCTEITVHADPGALVTADLTLFADADGEPLLEGKSVLDGEETRTATFPFVVSEMRVRRR